MPPYGDEKPVTYGVAPFAEQQQQQQQMLQGQFGFGQGRPESEQWPQQRMPTAPTRKISRELVTLLLSSELTATRIEVQLQHDKRLINESETSPPVSTAFFNENQESI
ncbi:unnamed protein product [Nippostrongylus brasiliensis]|uniref:Uncharacterized protein n=1 Tax=Nippostrongylus brasiliensis TaxID=27835 RepID=A0A0N4YYY4_NIPBR|nr:unnamed protein product [Nippostrongylus brasiliensis]